MMIRDHERGGTTPWRRRYAGGAAAVPQPGHGEGRLEVEVASICGTDVKVLHRTLQGQPAGEFIRP